jgi:magnesium-transporting ATPase (P-type)
VGFLGLADPLRPDVPQAIATAQRAGVRVVMITGDRPVTARAIADLAGLPPGPVLCGADLPAQAGESSAAGTALSEAALSAAVAAVSVFARVLPQQKLELVRALQAGGAVVAMTGDGVNDAAALKAADIGVAMGRRGTVVGRRVDANLQRALAPLPPGLLLVLVVVTTVTLVVASLARADALNTRIRAIRLSPRCQRVASSPLPPAFPRSCSAR